MSYLEIDLLTLRKGDFQLSCSLSLDKGFIGVLLGPSGSGKSTLLRCISGLEVPDSGEIRLADTVLGKLPPEHRNIGFVFQDLALFDHLDGRQNIEFGMRVQKVVKATRVQRTEELAKTMKMTALLSRMPATMSGGERQRLALARSLAVKPKLILLDEPLSALDAPLRKELREFIRSTLHLSSSTALHVTHDVEEALDLGDKIFLMRSGRILAAGSPEFIFANPPDSWSVSFLALGITLKAQIIAEQGSHVLVSTIAGRLKSPRPTTMADSYSIFLPSAQVRLLRSDEKLPEVVQEANVIDFKVEKASFNGRGRKISVRAIAEASAVDSFESSIDSKWEAGDLLLAVYPIEACRLLPQGEA